MRKSKKFKKIASWLDKKVEKNRTKIEKYGYTVEELQDSFRSRFKFNIDYFIRWQKNYEFKGNTKTVRKRLF